ncbi:MAG: saccharopine dehydrogenase NADP-binding domain-containing protein, partial [Bacteroidetes bacterium]|nr:saccharopine dehydrogenase NADP-binding domain-containing protein [Bacteroidota bacterium]
MTKILIIGAGRSATSLIEYLLQHALIHNWQITVADFDVNLAQQKIANHKHAKAISLDIKDEEKR